MTIAPNSRVLISGAASGLGLALTRQFVTRGCRVLAVDLAESTPDSLAGLANVTYRKLDVTSDQDWDSAHLWIQSQWKGLDYLVNNAGVAAGGRIELTSMEEWQWIVDINLFGVVRGCRVFTPMLKAQRTGHIVNIASAAGLIHPPRMSSYNAVKAGVVALSETLTHELGAFGIAVSVVCPTFFRTNLSDSLRGKDVEAEQSARKLIDKSKLSADQIAVEVMKGLEAKRPIILTDRPGRTAYAAKRFLRPVYFRQMAAVAKHMAAQESRGR